MEHGEQVMRIFMLGNSFTFANHELRILIGWPAEAARRT